MWYEWPDLDSFNTWHDALCQSLGYPLISINQQTGLPDEEAQKTERFVDAVVLDNKVVAFLTEHTQGLMESDYKPKPHSFISQA